jgi:hypothetical protein
MLERGREVAVDTLGSPLEIMAQWNHCAVVVVMYFDVWSIPSCHGGDS